MKALKILGFFASFIFFHSLFAGDIYAISEKINQLKQQATQNQNSVRALFQIETELKTYQPDLENCAREEHDILKKLKQETIFLENPEDDKFLQQQRQNQLVEIKKHKERYSICKYSLMQMKNLKKEIAVWNKVLYRGSYYKKYESFLSLRSKVKFYQISGAPPGYAFHAFLSQSSLIRNMRTFLIILAFGIFFKILFLISKINFFKFHEFKIFRFLFISLIFLSIAPVQYILMKIVYIHRDDVLLTLFERPLSYLLTGGFLLYMYSYYKYTNFKKEYFLIFSTLLLQAILIRTCFTHNYFDLYNINFESSLYMKYVILICQQILMFFIGYSLIYKILVLKKYQYKIFWGVEGLALTITMFGLYGYVDMAINVNFSMIIDGVLIVWMIIFTRIKNILLENIRNPEGDFKTYVLKFFGDYSHNALQNIKFMVYFLYFMTIFLIVLSMSIIFFWFLPDNSLEQIANFMLSSHLIGKMKVTPIRYAYAFIAFYFFNILNYAISSTMARRLFANPISIQKTGQLFYFIGLVLTWIIILILAGFEFENFVLILGGLSFGVGLGLKNVLSNMFSSFFLFVNRPYDIGDYIEINNVTGYVKKMTLFETVIETADKNIMILPNQYVASSVIQNYTYNQKAFHKVHFKYLFSEFHLKDEETIKNIITDYLNNKQNILTNQENLVKFIFFPIPHSGDIFGLELIFSLKSLKYIDESTSELSCEILELLKDKGLNVKFEELWHPLKGSSVSAPLRGNNDNF